MRNPIDLYRNQGWTALAEATVAYLRWLIEYRLIATVVHANVILRGGRIQSGGLTIDVTDAVIGKATAYRIFTGEYEQDERAMLEAHLHPGSDIIELGGGIGVTACHTNRLLREGTTHVVVEANPELLDVLRRNSTLNDCDFEIQHKAYDADRDSVKFDVGPAFESGSVEGDDGTSAPASNPKHTTYEVPSVTLADLLEDYELESFTLIADKEGAEIGLLTHESDLLRESCDYVFMETHPDDDGDMSAERLLNEAGFSLLEKSGDVVVYVSK